MLKSGLFHIQKLIEDFSPQKMGVHTHQTSSQEKGTQFQTLPPARLQVIYDNRLITQTAENLKKMGLLTDFGKTSESGILKKLRRTAW